MIYEAKITRQDGASWTLIYDDMFGADKCTPEHAILVGRCLDALTAAAVMPGDDVSVNAILHTFTALFRNLTQGGVKLHPGDIQALLKSMGAAPFGGDKTKGSA